MTVDHLVGATSLWHNAPPYYVHPDLVRDWRRLRDGLPQVTVPPQPKVFVTRPMGANRSCRNGADVESLFASHGFAVLRPENLTIPEQAALFAQARVVAGFGGSGMFNLLYADALEQVVVLNQSEYWGRSEHLFATALGVDSHFFWRSRTGDTRGQLSGPPGRLGVRLHRQQGAAREPAPACSRGRRWLADR